MRLPQWLPNVMNYEGLFPGTLSSRLPRVRFTVRRMMVGVAIVALILVGSRIVWLRHRYRNLAQSYDVKEFALAFGVQDERVSVESVRAWKKIEYYAALKRKYERAASRPWVPVPPDPPPPQ